MATSRGMMLALARERLVHGLDLKLEKLSLDL